MSNKYEFKGTKGEWEIRDAGSYEEWVGSHSFQNKGGIVCNSPYEGEESRKEWEYNKHLISAAPELLQACIGMMDICNKYNLEQLTPEYTAMAIAVNKALNINE